MFVLFARTRANSSQVPIPVHAGLGKSKLGWLKKGGDHYFANRRQPWKAFINLLMALALLFGSYSSGQAQSKAAQTLLTIIAEADSRVPEAKPDVNFGNDPVLFVDGGEVDPDIETYIRFTVTDISGTVSNAQLRLFVTDATQNGPALYTTSNSWNETDITWNNRPAQTSVALADKDALTKDSWVDYDVTNTVTANGTYSFVLATDAANLVGFSSREGIAAPQLIVTLAEAATIVAPNLTPTIQPIPTVIIPAASPVAILATAIALQPNIAPLADSIQPDNLSSEIISSTITYTSVSILISSAEIRALPTSGTAWNNMRTAAYGSWGTADLKSQDNKHAIYTLAGALTYARTGDTALRSKVKSAILAAKRSLDQSSEWQTTNA